MRAPISPLMSIVIGAFVGNLCGVVWNASWVNLVGCVLCAVLFRSMCATLARRADERDDTLAMIRARVMKRVADHAAFDGADWLVVS